MHFGLFARIKKNKLLHKLLAIVTVLAVSSVSVEAARTSHKPSSKIAKVRKKVHRHHVKRVRPKTRVRKHRGRSRAENRRLSAKQAVARRAQVLRQQQAAAAEALRQQQAATALQQAEILRQQQEAARRQAELQGRAEANRLRAEARQQAQMHPLPLLTSDQFLDQPLNRIPSIRLNAQTFVDEDYILAHSGYPNGLETTQQYGFGLPTAPVFHPYDLQHISDVGGTLIGYRYPSFSFSAKLPGYTPQFELQAPDDLKRNLAGIRNEDIDVFIIAQDRPSSAAVPMLFRPQYWLDPDAPFEEEGNINHDFAIQAGLFSGVPGAPLIHDQPAGGLINQNVSVHNGLPDNPELLVSSGNTLHIDNLGYGRSHVFYSLTKHGAKAAIVKHFILNTDDEETFQNVLIASPTLREFKNNLRGARAYLSRDFADEIDF
ncbi:MAG: hypothetical protein BGO67_01000 [Alphaproteobacteria bacterium 41-28]|nr:MAG: hypothetical protein BGO67_01000 [Alphaproteobacteria bacterium 41-28]